MKALAIACLTFAACSSSSSSLPPDGSTIHHLDSASPTGDAPANTGGFAIDIGQAYTSSAAVTIAAVTQNQVYAGYFQAMSDGSSTPSLTVSIVADGGVLQTGSYPCANSQTDNPFDETSVLIHWLDGDTYYTNEASPSCTIDVTAASQTSVSAMISGTIYDESQGAAATSFTASFVATVQ